MNAQTGQTNLLQSVDQWEEWRQGPTQINKSIERDDYKRIVILNNIWVLNQDETRLCDHS